MDSYFIKSITKNEVVTTIRPQENVDTKLKALTLASNLSKATVGGKYLVINEHTGFRFIVIRGRIKPLGILPTQGKD